MQKEICLICNVEYSLQTFGQKLNKNPQCYRNNVIEIHDLLIVVFKTKLLF